MTAVSLPLAPHVTSDSAIDLHLADDQIDQQSQSAKSSLSIDQPRLEAIESLLEVAAEASTEDWDAHGGRPVSGATLSQAVAFLTSLPSTAPTPEVSAHPDGELAFYWSMGPRRTLTISIGATGRLSFAALIGHRRFFGSEYLTDELPEAITLALRQLHSSAS